MTSEAEPERSSGRQLWRPHARSYRLALRWSLLAIPSTALAFAGIGVVLAFGYPGGFVGLTFGPAKDALLGALMGAAWALLLVIPHTLVLSSYLKLAGRQPDALEATRGARVLALFGCAAPQALLLALLVEPAVGFVAWAGVAFGLWLPRTLARALRPA